MPSERLREKLFDHSTNYPNSREVKVSIMFTRLAEIDTINERFSCEATLFFTWNEPIMCTAKIKDGYSWNSKDFWDPQIYVENALGDVKEKDVKHRVGRLFDAEKQAWFFEVHMIKRIQDLSLILTSHRTLDEINLVQDLNILAKTKSASLDKHIWKLYDHVNIKIHTIKSDISPNSDYLEKFERACSHPAITMQCRVSRKPGYFVINCLLPTLMITLCVFFTFMMDYKRYQYRFSLLFTTMLTSITFRWAIQGRVLPTISYMTFLDVYCVSSIMIVFSAMIWHATYLVLYKKDPLFADKCDFNAMILFGLVVLLIHVMQTIWFFIALKKRLIFENLDKRAAHYLAPSKNKKSNQSLSQDDNLNTFVKIKNAHS